MWSMLEGFLLHTHDLSSENALEEENKRPKTYKWMPDDCEVTKRANREQLEGPNTQS